MWLIACEESGVVRDAFLKRGIPAISCDLAPSRSPGPHIVGDVLNIIDQGWTGIIAFPPCTRLCGSGAHHLKGGNDQKMMEDMRLGAELFLRCLYAKRAKYVAVENPVMHEYALRAVRKYPSQIFQPYQFGDMFKKRTCLWLRGLPKLVPTTPWVKGSDPRLRSAHMMPDSKNRARDRAETQPGVAAAMAEQWGKYV